MNSDYVYFEDCGCEKCLPREAKMDNEELEKAGFKRTPMAMKDRPLGTCDEETKPHVFNPLCVNWKAMATKDRCPTCGAENRDEPERRECAMMCPPSGWRWVKDEFLNATDQIVCADPWHEERSANPARYHAADCADSECDGTCIKAALSMGHEGRSSPPAPQNCNKCDKPYFDPRTSTIASGSVEKIQDWYCMCGTVTNLAVNTTTLAPRDSRSEAGRVKLSGVQDHADMAQIVGGELSGEELNRAYLFMHAWWKRSAKHPDRKPPKMMKIRRNRIASLLAEYAQSEGAPLPAPSREQIIEEIRNHPGTMLFGRSVAEIQRLICEDESRKFPLPAPSPLAMGLSKTYEFSTQGDAAKAMEMGKELYEFGRAKVGDSVTPRPAPSGEMNLAPEMIRRGYKGEPKDAPVCYLCHKVILVPHGRGKEGAIHWSCYERLFPGSLGAQEKEEY